MNTYNERIAAMSDKLDFYGIPHEIDDCYDGAQIRFPWCIGDVACHKYTCGCKIGYVETYRFPWDDEEHDEASMLDPEEAIDKIVQYYIKELKRLFISPIKPFLAKEDLE